MKKYISFMAGMLLAILFASCEKDLQVYSDSTCRLNFYYDIESVSSFKESMARSTYSFVYGSSGVERDTLWYEMETMGFVADHDRAITLVQVDSVGVTNAVAGKHYVSFDDPSVAHYYVVPAGKARVKVPVIILRDASLKNETVVLKFKIEPNAEFEQGYSALQARVVQFTDQLSEPSKWSYGFPDSDYSSYTVSLSDYFGAYGVVKHQFLIEQTGEKWDDDYIEKLMTGDSNYLMYLLRKMSKRLDEVNAERASRGEGPLTEADGTVVEIADPYAY